MLFIFFPTSSSLIYPGSLKAKKRKRNSRKRKENTSPKKSYIVSLTHSLSLSLQIPGSFLTLPSLSIPTDLFSCLVKYSILSKSHRTHLRTQKSSMQPRRSRFTELIDVPPAEATGSSSDLSLDDVLRETEQYLLSQNRVLSFWNGWDHVGSEVQRRQSRPRSRLRKKRIGEIPRNVLWF